MNRADATMAKPTSNVVAIEVQAAGAVPAILTVHHAGWVGGNSMTEPSSLTLSMLVSPVRFAYTPIQQQASTFNFDNAPSNQRDKRRPWRGTDIRFLIEMHMSDWLSRLPTRVQYGTGHAEMCTPIGGIM